MSQDNEMMDFASAMAAFEAKEFSRAIQLLSPYAQQGDAEAQHRLAIMYQNGLGVAQNDTEAVKWMQAAAEQLELTHPEKRGCNAGGDGNRFGDHHVGIIRTRTLRVPLAMHGVRF